MTLAEEEPQPGRGALSAVLTGPAPHEPPRDVPGQRTRHGSGQSQRDLPGFSLQVDPDPHRRFWGTIRAGRKAVTRRTGR